MRVNFSRCTAGGANETHRAREENGQLIVNVRAAALCAVAEILPSREYLFRVIMNADGRRIRPSFCDETNNERSRETRMRTLDGGCNSLATRLIIPPISLFTLSGLAARCGIPRRSTARSILLANRDSSRKQCVAVSRGFSRG